jgi:hypothetical protein
VTEYPNREHENADKVARRRVQRNISDISEQLATLTRRLRLAESTDSKGLYVDAADARPIVDAANRLTENLARLETLRDVREWPALVQPRDTGQLVGLEPIRNTQAALDRLVERGEIEETAGGYRYTGPRKEERA